MSLNFNSLKKFVFRKSHFRYAKDTRYMLWKYHFRYEKFTFRKWQFRDIISFFFNYVPELSLPGVDFSYQKWYFCNTYMVSSTWSDSFVMGNSTSRNGSYGREILILKFWKCDFRNINFSLQNCDFWKVRKSQRKYFVITVTDDEVFGECRASKW